RLFFSGQIISLIGTWMQAIALSWLVYRMTNSPLLLGLVSFSSQIPTLIISPFAGVISDRVNKHKIIILTQALSMVQALVLAALVLTGNIQIWHIFVLNIFLGIVNGFDIPNRQAFVVEMIENREDLGNAIALNSSVFNGARLIGPSIAGVLISLLGEGICFLINGLSYIAVIAALFAMRLNPIKKEVSEKKVMEELKEGFQYTFNSVPIRSMLLLLALMSLVGMPYTVLMPVFAKTILGGNAQTLGFLLAAVGVGALSGAFYLASRKTVLGLGKFIARGALIFGAGLIIFSFSRTISLSIIFLIITGASLMIQMASTNTIIQTITEDKMRGRVMSFYTMSFMGLAPFGSLIAGTIANNIGAPLTLASGGFFCIVGGLVFLSMLPNLRRIVHPVYVEKGIIKEIAEGIDKASKSTV
ncbi:MAG: MFS transporter, partial [Syntrophothermus sp.]